MVKSTIIFIFFLSILASLLAGINIGKKIERFQSKVTPTSSVIPVTLTPKTLPTITPVASPSADTTDRPTSKSTYRNRTCGFEFSYPGSYISQKSTNEQSVIFTDPNDPSSAIASTCATEIPKPPLPPEKIETITLDSLEATLYHDKSAKDGSLRDEVIVKHPTNGKEIIIAGFGSAFQSALSSFKFIK